LGLIDKIRDNLSLRGNIPPLLLTSLLEGSAWNMHEIVWQPFVLSLGGSISNVGLLSSIWSAVYSILQFATGELADCVGRKKVITAYYIISILGLAFSLFSNSWIHLIPIIILYGFADAVGEPAYSPIYAESVDEKKIGLALSLYSLTWWLPGLYSQILGGYLGDYFGLRQVIAITLSLEIITLFLFIVLVKETLKETKLFKLDSVVKNLKGLLSPIGELKTFYALSMIDRFSWMISGSIFIAMIYDTYGFSLLKIGILLTAMSTTTALLVVPVGKIVDRYGCLQIIRVSAILSVLVFFSFNYAKDFNSILLVQIVRGAAIALWDPSTSVYLTKTVFANERGRHFGNLNGLKGLVGFPAPMIGALLYENYGLNGAFTVSTLGLFLTTILAFRVNDDARARG
jgi:MFS family permease